MRLHRILPLAAAALLVTACQSDDPTSPTLAPAESARFDGGVQMGGSGGYTGGVNMGGSGGYSEDASTSSTTPPDTTNSRGVNMFGGG